MDALIKRYGCYSHEYYLRCLEKDANGYRGKKRVKIRIIWNYLDLETSIEKLDLDDTDYVIDGIFQR